MNDEIVYVVADNGFDEWNKRSVRKLTIKKNTVYKGIVSWMEYIRGENSHAVWTYVYPPFRKICRIEAFVLSRGKIEEIELLP